MAEIQSLAGLCLDSVVGGGMGTIPTMQIQQQKCAALVLSSLMKKLRGFYLLSIYYTGAQLKPRCTPTALRWRHNDCGGVSNHQPHDCLLNRIFGRISKEHQSSASLAFVREIHRGPVNFPRKWPVTRKMFPFDDVIMGDRVHCYATVVHQHL